MGWASVDRMAVPGPSLLAGGGVWVRVFSVIRPPSALAPGGRGIVCRERDSPARICSASRSSSTIRSSASMPRPFHQCRSPDSSPVSAHSGLGASVSARSGLGAYSRASDRREASSGTAARRAPGGPRCDALLQRPQRAADGWGTGRLTGRPSGAPRHPRSSHLPAALWAATRPRVRSRRSPFVICRR